MLDEYALFVTTHKTVLPLFSFVFRNRITRSSSLFGVRTKGNPFIPLESESKVEDIAEVSIETASREWPTGGRPTND